MRFEEIYEQRTHKQLTVEQAADLLGIHERTFRRWVARYEEEGATGLADQRLDRVAHNAAPVDEVMALLSLYETRYSTWTACLLQAGQPLLRPVPSAPPGRAQLYLGEEYPASSWGRTACQAARRPPPQAPAQAAGGHDAASGWLYP